MVPAILIALLLAAAVLVLLWRREKATPLPELPPDPAEIAAARIAVDRMTSVQWARHILSSPDGYAIAMIAASGQSQDAELIGIAVADIDGSIRFTQRVRPPKGTRIDKGAPVTRGIRATDVKSMPSWRDVGPRTVEAVGPRTIVTDDPAFVESLVRKSFERTGIDWPGWSFEGANDHLRKFQDSLSGETADASPQPGYAAPAELEAGCHALIDAIWLMAGKGSVPDRAETGPSERGEKR